MKSELPPILFVKLDYTMIWDSNDVDLITYNKLLMYSPDFLKEINGQACALVDRACALVDRASPLSAGQLTQNRL